MLEVVLVGAGARAGAAVGASVGVEAAVSRGRPPLLRFEDYCLALRTELDIKKLNATWALMSSRTKDLWKSPMGTVIRIELLVVLAAIMLSFLTIFGSWRRKRRSWFVQNSVLGAYTLSSSLVTYLLGSMQSSVVKSNLYPIWAISLYILLGCADSITAYNLDDNKQMGRQFYRFMMYNLYVALLVCSISSAFGYILAFCLALIAEVKFMHKMCASLLASVSWNLNKMVADYMYHQEHTKSGPAYDPVSMKGYHYLVDWPLDNSELEADTLCARVDDAQAIDIEMVWQCPDETLSQELKDTCLSFSLFHLLRRRFFGFECGESSRAKTHDFVFKGLLSKKMDESMDYIRVFKVIEEELAFVYDFFFTKYAAVYYRSGVAICMSVASACLISVTAYLTASRVFKISSLEKEPVILDTTRFEVVISIVILVCIALIEVLQLLHYRTTIWARVSLACQRVREQPLNKHGGFCVRFKEILAKIGVYVSNEHYFEEKFGQYCLLESVSYHLNPSKYSFLDILIKAASPIFLTDSRAFHPIRHHRQRSVVRKSGEPAGVPAELKEAVVQSLERTDGKLTNGASSLVLNGASHLLWACRYSESSGIVGYAQKKENQACFILTWHIATCYCEMGTGRCPYPDQSAGRELTKKHHEVATKLSKYCAYLVVSAPKLLPGHHYDTTRVFEAVAEEAMQSLQGAENKYEAMMRSLPESEEKIFHKGMRLGKQLEEMEMGARWKVLADFWAEMLLYLAPSDNVNEHIECLAKGGELITHLWALLTHAGILERDHQWNVIDIENGGGDCHPSPGNQLPSRGSCVQPGTMVPQQENTVQIIGAPDASTASSEITAIES